MRPIINPPLDPLAQKAAINALEAQRAAYRRYARTVEAQQHTFGDGDGDKAVQAVDTAVRGFAELDEGAKKLQPLVDHALSNGAPDQVQDMQRRMEDLLRDARNAETAIQNLTSQLEAWRDAYGKQLTNLGMTPGSTAGGTSDVAAGTDATDAARRAGPYAKTPGVKPRTQSYVLDRKA